MAPRIPELSSTFGDYPHAAVALSRGLGPQLGTQLGPQLGPQCSLGGYQS